MVFDKRKNEEHNYVLFSLQDVVDGVVTYSIDDCRTRFFDLLQMVEFYQLNRGSLSARLTHYIVSLESAMTSESNVSQKKAISCSDPEVNIKSDMKNNQDISLDSNRLEYISDHSGTELSSIKSDLNSKTHKNGSVKSPEDVSFSPQRTGSITPER